MENYKTTRAIATTWSECLEEKDRNSTNTAGGTTPGLWLGGFPRNMYMTNFKKSPYFS